MATLILRPNADSAITQNNSALSGVDNYSFIDEVTLSEVDFVGCLGAFGTNSFQDLYTLPNHTTEAGVINSVTIKCYAKRTNTVDATVTLVKP
jgi:hypothetical protein